MKIKNVIGSSKISKNAPKTNTCWRDYWESRFGYELEEGVMYECPACGNGVTKEHIDGCHVQKVNSIDKSWYIVPLCDSCNQKTGELDVDETLLVPVPNNV